jgi:hypothetical protein
VTREGDGDDHQLICPGDGFAVEAADEGAVVDEFTSLRRGVVGPVRVARADADGVSRLAES